MKQIDRFRQIRREVYQNLFSSRDLCIAGLLMMLAFLFNPYTISRIIQFILFLFFAWLAGKKNNLFITLIIMMGIILFNLIVPYGEEIFRLGSFRITEGALWGGIHRAVTLEGLIMLSRFCIRPDLKLPGTFGALIGESFRMLEKINERKGMINRKNIIGGIDQLMMELDNDEILLPEETIQNRSVAGIPMLGITVPGIIILIGMCVLIIFITVFPFIFPDFRF
jgi:heptaprenyl diphosphate synthase